MNPKTINISTDARKNGQNDLSSMGRRIGINSLWLLLGRLGSQVLMLLFTMLIAQRLGEQGLGQYAFIVSVVFLANVLTTFGTDMFLIREIAAKADLSSVPTALLIQLGLSVPIAGLTFLIAPKLPNQSSEAVAALQLYGLALFPLAFYTVFSAALRGTERMGLFTIVNLVTTIMQVGAVWILITPQSSIILLAQLLLGVQVLSSLFAGWLCFAKIPGFRDVWRFTYNSVSVILRASAPIAFLGFLTILYQKLGLYLLSTMDGAAATGLFSAAMRVMEAPKVIHIATLGALFPAMAQAHTQPIGKLKSDSEGKTFSFSWGLLLAFASIIAVVLYLLSIPIISILYGSGFESSIPALKILAWILIPFTINIYLSLLFLAARKEKQIMLAIVVSLIVLFIFNFIWIPRWGVVGASWAALIAEFTQAGMYLLLRKDIKNASSKIFDEADDKGLEA